jgi:hypothetical protein
MRAVDSTELLVETPQITSGAWPAVRNRSSRPVRMKAVGCCFATIGSSGSGRTTSLKSCSGWPGRKLEFGSRESCLT